MNDTHSGWRARALGVLGASPQERWRTLGLFTFFFLVIAAFWIQKPIRTARFLSEVGPNYLPLVKLGTAALILPIALLYSAAAARYRREGMVYGCVAVFAAGTVAFWWLLSRDAPLWSHYAYFFYVDIFSSVMVALFWSYANDLTSPEAARRSYGFIGAGGILGGVVGSALTGVAVKAVGTANLLLGCLVVLGAIALVAFGIARLGSDDAAADQAQHQPTPTLRDAIAGAHVTVASRYLTAIALLVALYEIVSNVIDFQFNTVIATRYTSDAALASFLGYFNSAAISASLVAQLLLTTWLLHAWGPRVALLILPIVLGAGSGAFILVPLFPVIAASFFSDATLSYSLNQSAKEVLYTPTDAATKYQAKAFIDMFVMRLAKGVGSLLILGWIAWLSPLGWQTQHLGWLSVAVVLLWLVVARAAGRAFAEQTQSRDSDRRAADTSDRPAQPTWLKPKERYGAA